MSVVVILKKLTRSSALEAKQRMLLGRGLRFVTFTPYCDESRLQRDVEQYLHCTKLSAFLNDSTWLCSNLDCFSLLIPRTSNWTPSPDLFYWLDFFCERVQ